MVDSVTKQSTTPISLFWHTLVALGISGMNTSCGTCETTLCYGSNVRSTLNAMLSSSQMQEVRSTDISLTKIVGTRSNGSGWSKAIQYRGRVPKQDHLQC